MIPTFPRWWMWEGMIPICCYHRGVWGVGWGGYLALTGGDDSRTVGADEPGFILSF